MDYSNRIKELRIEKDFTQRELAFQLGLSSNIICEWEKGRCAPSLEALKNMAKIFECSTDYLLGLEDDFGIIQTKSPGEELTGEEKQLLKTFRKLNTKNRMHVSAYAEVRLEEQERETSRRA